MQVRGEGDLRLRGLHHAAGHLGGAATRVARQLPGGITFLAATGDYGAYAANSTTITPQYPASSPNVVAVGGTTLTVSGNSYVSETGWGSGTNSGTSTAAAAAASASTNSSRPGRTA